MGRYRFVWFPARISKSRENPGKTHIVDEYSSGIDAEPHAELLCGRPVSERYWSAEKCRREGINISDEPSREGWPTCEQCRTTWIAILESAGEAVEYRSIDSVGLQEESLGFRPVGETVRRREARDTAIRGRLLFPSLGQRPLDETAWDIPVGAELPRREIHERIGGSRQNGMTRAAGTSNLLLFSSSSGARYGYNYDGWRDDGAFHYTGEGQVGDQRFVRNNLALRDHPTRGLRPRLFEEVRRSIVRYVGEFIVETQHPWYAEEAPDRLGDLRKVIVFRLTPVTAKSPKQTPAVVLEKPVVRDVPVEAHLAETFQMEPRRSATVAERREADLVARYVASLRSDGTVVTRKEIKLPDQGRALYTDVFDASRTELVEAKGSASRYHVRHALGQLLDYQRYVEHSSLAILLPTEPGTDLVQLLHGMSITCIFEDAPNDFRRLSP